MQNFCSSSFSSCWTSENFNFLEAGPVGAALNQVFNHFTVFCSIMYVSALVIQQTCWQIMTETCFWNHTIARNLRKEQSAHFHDFSLRSVISELRAHAPDIHRLFMTLGGTSHDVTSDDSHSCVEEIRAIASLCTLLKEHSVRVKGILLLAFILL